MRYGMRVVGLVSLAVNLACDSRTPTTTATPNGPPQSALLQERARGCGSECAAILREAIAWVSRDAAKRVAPPASKVLLDTMESGYVISEHERALPATLLADVSRAAQIGGLVARSVVADCFSPFRPVPDSCAPLKDKVIVTVFAPTFVDASRTMATLDLHEGRYSPPWQPRPDTSFRPRMQFFESGWRLTLQQVGKGWQVIKVEHTFYT